MMNKKHALHLFQTGYTTAEFNFTNNNTHPRNIYTFKVLLSDNFGVGDCAVVILDTGLKIVKCLEVHEKPQIDIHATFDYKWVVQKIDHTRYDELIAAEQIFNDAIQDMEKERLQAEVRAHILETAGENSDVLKIFNGAVKSLNETLGAEVVSNSEGKNND